jgi:hypothetical protein
MRRAAMVVLLLGAFSSRASSIDVVTRAVAVAIRTFVQTAPKPQTPPRVTLHWWTTANLAQLAAPPHDCSPETSPKKEVFQATLLFCGDDARKLNKYIHASDCRAIGERALAMDVLHGEAVFDDVTPGVYLMQVSYPSLPILKKQFEVVARGGADVDFELRWFTFFGKVTRDGQPVMASLYGTVSDPVTGRYDAVLPRDPRENPVEVATCDGAVQYTIVPDAAPAENAAFDIEIARNRIDVKVVDAETKMPIADAMVSLAASVDDDPSVAHFAGPAGKTDERGLFVIEPVLANKELHICASTDAHERACAEPFRMGKSKQRGIRLELARVVKRRGRSSPRCRSNTAS